MTRRRIYDRPQVTDTFSLVALPIDGTSPGDAVSPVSLRAARLSRDMTVDDLAARSGISMATIYRIEHGKTTPRPHVVRRLSAALGLAPWIIEEFAPVLKDLRLRSPTLPIA